MCIRDRAITSKINGKLDAVDIDTKLGDALVNSGLNSVLGSSSINNNYNQRLTGTTWGEVGFTSVSYTHLDVYKIQKIGRRK